MERVVRRLLLLTGQSLPEGISSPEPLHCVTLGADSSEVDGALWPPSGFTDLTGMYPAQDRVQQLEVLGN